MRWFSTRRARRSARPTAPIPSRPRARSSWPSPPAASAAPTCTSSTASCGAEAAARAGSPGRRPSGHGGRALRSGRPGRHPLARLDVRRVPLLPERPREPLRSRPLHRLPPRRRLRGARGGRRALLRGAPDGLRRSAGGAAPLRRADRLSRAAARRRRRALGLYGFGASAHIVCQVARHEGRRVFAFTRADDTEAQALRARARRGVGRRLARARRRRSSTPPSCSPPSASSSPRRCARPRRAATVVVRRHPHDATSLRSPTSCSGGSGSCARSPTSHAPTRPSSWSWHRRCRCAPRWRRSRSRRRTTRSPGYAPVDVRGAAVLVVES